MPLMPLSLWRLLLNFILLWRWHSSSLDDFRIIRVSFNFEANIITGDPKLGVLSNDRLCKMKSGWKVELPQRLINFMVSHFHYILTRLQDHDI